MTKREQTEEKESTGEKFWRDRAATVAAFRAGTDFVSEFYNAVAAAKAANVTYEA